MGDAGFGIYVIREKTGFIHLLEAVPDSHDQNAIAHLHLDVIEANGGPWTYLLSAHLLPIL